MAFGRFSSEDFSVFVHEYFHFIQDISTYYGLNNMYVYSEYLRFAINQIYQSPNHCFKVPITPNNYNQQNVFLNSQISKFTNGDSCEIDVIKAINSIDIVKQETGTLGTKLDEIESAIITGLDNNNEEFIVAFGAICIKENISYIMEQFICDKHEGSPDFPYTIAEKVANEIYPDFAKDKLNVLALCDISLMYSNPGPVYIHFLNEYKDQCWLPSRPEDIYDNVLGRGNILNGDSVITIESSYNRLVDTVKSQLKGYFNDPEIFSNLTIWLVELLDLSKEKRFSDQSFILKIARNGRSEFEKLLYELGTPLISNDMGECTLLYPSKPEDGVEIGYFYAIGQIINFFESGNTECKMQKICIMNMNHTDSRCIINPWSRCNDEFKCPYALLWKHWNLSKYEPII